MKTGETIPLSLFYCPFPLRRLTRPEFDEMSRLAADARQGYEAQLRRFLALTPLTALHWVNLHHHEVQLVTISK